MEIFIAQISFDAWDIITPSSRSCCPGGLFLEGRKVIILFIWWGLLFFFKIGVVVCLQRFLERRDLDGLHAYEVKSLAVILLDFLTTVICVSGEGSLLQAELYWESIFSYLSFIIKAFFIWENRSPLRSKV